MPGETVALDEEQYGYLMFLFYGEEWDGQWRPRWEWPRRWRPWAHMWTTGERSLLIVCALATWSRRQARWRREARRAVLHRQLLAMACALLWTTDCYVIYRLTRGA